jgi:PAS domain S-box-containing protein
MAKATVVPLPEADADLTEAPIKVLHVDDDAGYLKTAKMILKMQGSFKVETAASVEEAQEKMRQKEFDVIVCDYIMPGKDGLEFLKELRDSENTIPFIIFTGKGREIVAIRALNLGADQYVNKIGKPEAVYSELAHGICTVVKGKKAEEALRASEEKLRNIFQSANDCIFYLDKSGRIIDVNRKAVQLFGRSRKELLGRHFAKVGGISLKEIPRVMKAFAQSLADRQRTLSVCIKDKRGQGIPLECSSSLVKADGKITGMLIIARDITERKKAEEVLKKERQELDRIIDSSPIIIFYKDKEGKFLRVNNTFAETQNLSKEEFLGKTVFDLYSPKIAQSMTKDDLEVLELGRPKLGIVEQYESARGMRWVQTDKIPIFNKKGSVIGLVGFAQDITKRKAAEDALRKSEDKSRTLLENLPQKIFFKDKNSVYISCNENYARDLKIHSDEIAGKTDYDFYPKILAEKYRADDKRVMESGKTEEIDEGYIQDEHRVFVHTVKTPVKDENGNVIGILGIFWDITERKKAEDALRESEAKLKTVFAASPDAIIVSDINANVVDCNQAALEIIGCASKEEVIGKNSVEFIAEKDRNRALKNLKKTLEQGTVRNIEYTLLKKDGEEYQGELSVNIIKDSSGNPTGFVGIVRDITERKNVERKLQVSEKSWSDSFNSLEDVMIIIGKDFTIKKMNDIGLKLLGKTREEVVGKKCYQLIHGLDSPGEFCPYERTLKTGKVESVERYEKKFDKYFSIKSSPIFNERGETLGFVDLMRDVTERKNAEKALREAEKKYRKTILKANVGIIGYDAEGKVKVLNPKMWQMTGYKRSEIPTLQDWFKKLYPNEEERRKIRDRWFKRMSEEGEVKEGHAIIITKDGKRRNFLFNGVRLESGDSIAFAEDITDRKEAEKKLDGMINELVTINEKLGVVGKLTRHDARNKLSVIANNIYLAKQKLAANNDALKFLGDIESAVDQMEELFDFARTYEMLGIEELSPMDVAKSVDEAVMLFSGVEGIKIVNECRGLTVMADSLLRQLFYNLIDDTLKHGEKVSQIRVYYEEGADQLKLVYEDDGVGIPENEKELIFKEGYGKGTGYGLYLIKKICEEYGWTIRETGKLGKGAQFTMIIPKTNRNGKRIYKLS